MLHGSHRHRDNNAPPQLCNKFTGGVQRKRLEIGRAGSQTHPSCNVYFIAAGRAATHGKIYCNTTPSEISALFCGGGGDLLCNDWGLHAQQRLRSDSHAGFWSYLGKDIFTRNMKNLIIQFSIQIIMWLRFLVVGGGAVCLILCDILLASSDLFWL